MKKLVFYITFAELFYSEFIVNFLLLANFSFYYNFVVSYMGLPGGSDSKESSCSAGDLGVIPGLGRSPGRGHGNPLQYSCLENPHGHRSLAGYSPWGCKE